MLLIYDTLQGKVIWTFWLVYETLIHMCVTIQTKTIKQFFLMLLLRFDILQINFEVLLNNNLGRSQSYQSKKLIMSALN